MIETNSDGRSFEHFVDNVSKPRASSPFTNCKGAEDREYVTEICETAPLQAFAKASAEGLGEREAFDREFKKETCRSKRCAMRYEKHAGAGSSQGSSGGR